MRHSNEALSHLIFVHLRHVRTHLCFLPVDVAQSGKQANFGPQMTQMNADKDE